MDKTLDILLVEDLDSDAELLEYYLHESGYNFNIRRVDNKESFCREVEIKIPDIVLADYSLPQFSGLSALKILKEINEDVPFILVTGTQSEEVAVNCMVKGADDYILKHNLTRLSPAIENALSNSETKRQKKAIEFELIKSEEKYRLITENSRDLICMLDSNGICLYASPSFEEGLGYKPSELLGSNLFDLIHPDDINSVLQIWIESKENQSYGDAVFRYKNKTGEWRIFESRGNWINNNGDENKAVIVSRDITERVIAVENLKKERDFNKRIIQETPALVVGISPHGNTTFINPSVTKITGYSEEEIIGKNWWDSLYPGDLHEQVDKLFSEFKNGEVKDYEMTLKTKNGDLKIISWNSINKHDEAGKINEIIGFGYDVTERKNYEENIINSLREKELLIKELHHRVKNNLQVISSIFYLQSEKTDNATLHEIMEECKNRVNSMALIHENFYQSSDLSKINLKNYIEDLANNLSMSQRRDKDIVIHTNIEDILLNIDIAIPCGLLINELISNCFKHAFPHGKGGNIWIEMKKLIDDEYLLRIKDDGIGIPDDFSLNSSKSLGMEIVSTLVEQIEGEIEFKNDDGTEFTIKLNINN